MWHQKGKVDRAIAGYQKVLAAEPAHWASLLAVEELLVAQGDEATAVSLYRKAVQHHAVEDQFRQAELLPEQGKLDQAIATYQKVLELKPTHAQALLALEKLLSQTGDFMAAIDAYRQAILHNPNDAELHKRHINLMTVEGGLPAAFEHYELARADAKTVEIAASDLLCCVVVRNELPRLPYFLDYYRHKGVAKFLIVDNDSTDETLAYLRQQPDVYVWHSAKSFNQVNFGSVWFELLLRQYGIGHWCLTVDADELLHYPDCEHKTILQLCQELDEKHYRAYTAVLLDMYSDQSIQETAYTPGQNFLEVCPYFDRQFYHRKQEQAGSYHNQTLYFGGLRERVFGAAGDYILSKVPLLKYGPEVVIVGGQHLTNLPETKIARESGCLLHFKYFSLFFDYVAKEVQRKEHYGDAHQYSEYARTLSTTPTLKLYDEAHSVQFQSSQQLVQLGILQVEPSPAESSHNSTLTPEFPPVLQLPPQTHRPLWSVMITAYKRVDYLEQCLRSVLEQAPDAREMQVEVVNDGAPESVQAEIAAIVDRVGQGRVSFYRHSENIGHPHIFNLCIQRAQGQWIHLLHDDDWVGPGFYAALQAGIETEPGIGAAFCRHTHIDEAGEVHWVSNLERGTSGILPNWIETIASHCQLQFSSIVVKRAAYETLGGFCAQANSAFDWEMWQRIAVRYPVWYEPQPLAYFREHSGAESYRLIQSGQQIVDTCAAIEVARTYLPRTATEQFSTRARKSYAFRALGLAKQQIERGEDQAAMANLREAVKCSQSQAVQQAIVQLLLQTHP